jgi:acetylornithine deacetylase
LKELFARVREAIDIPSPTGQEEEYARHVSRLLEEQGYPLVELQPVEGTRANLWARAGERPRVVMCTHLDCVPPWIGSSEDDENIYGRGSCDAKGIMLAMLAAGERLRSKGVTSFGFLFTVGEELDSVGAKVARALVPGSHHVIVGEPTEGRLATGHKGVFEFDLRAEGRAAHSAYPELGASAIERLLDALELVRRADWGHSERLGPATVNIGMIAGGVAANVIAPSAEARVMVRVVGEARACREILDELLAGRPGLSYAGVASSDAVYCETRPGFEAAPVRFGTDIPSLGGSFGKPLLVGPGSIHDAHTSDEKIGKAELVAAVDLYERLVSELLQEGEAS